MQRYITKYFNLTKYILMIICMHYTLQTMILCMQGFTAIAIALIKAGADLQHIPNSSTSSTACSSAAFMRGPSQSPLAEACRGGHTAIVRALLEAGAAKNQTNDIGWTPLHEVCMHTIYTADVQHDLYVVGLLRSVFKTVDS
jgi:Ankyrin repeats (3 copies)